MKKIARPYILEASLSIIFAMTAWYNMMGTSGNRTSKTLKTLINRVGRWAAPR